MNARSTWPARWSLSVVVVVVAWVDFVRGACGGGRGHAWHNVMLSPGWYHVGLVWVCSAKRHAQPHGPRPDARPRLPAMLPRPRRGWGPLCGRGVVCMGLRHEPFAAHHFKTVPRGPGGLTSPIQKKTQHIPHTFGCFFVCFFVVVSVLPVCRVLLVFFHPPLLSRFSLVGLWAWLTHVWYTLHSIPPPLLTPHTHVGRR